MKALRGRSAEESGAHQEKKNETSAHVAQLPFLCVEFSKNTAAARRVWSFAEGLLY
jgi:hypothetical protein